MSIRLFLFVIMQMICCQSFAQSHGYSISGAVSGEGRKPLTAVNVIVLADSGRNLVKAAVTDDKGHYIIENIVGGGYQMKLSLQGYASYTSDEIVIAHDTSLGTISLTPLSNSLKEIIVQSQRPLIEIKADRIVVNVESSIVNTGSTVLEVLGRSPGVSVDQDDNISLKGKYGLNIMIDGKTVPVSGSDLANMLKSMPSSSVDKIEIISNPGARYDAAGSAGMINIKTKKEKRMGVNGTLNITNGEGVYYKFNGSSSINYRTGKLNLNANYSYVNRTGFNHLSMTREFYENDILKLKYTQENNTVYPVSNHLAGLGLDYNPGTKTVVGFLLNGYKSHFEPSGDNASLVDSTNLSSFTTRNRSVDDWYNYSVNGYLRQSFDTTGSELEINLDYARFWNQTYQNYTNIYSHRSPYLLYGDLTGITQIRSVKADYTRPLKCGTKLEAGVKASYVTADTRPQYFDLSDGARVYDSTRSNHFIYQEQIYAGYINASRDIGSWSIQAGLRAEQTITVGEQKTSPASKLRREYMQLFPSLAVQRHINESHDLGFSISRRIDRPNYQQLNPFKFFLDPTNSKVGNPYLSPSLTWAAELSHTFRQKFLTTLSVSLASDMIVETLEKDTAYSDHSTQTDKNLAHQYYYGISCAYPFRIAKWWSNIINLNAYYSFFQGNLSNTPLSKGRLAMDINTTSSFTLPKSFAAELSFYYQSPLQWGFYELRSLSMLNLGLQRSFINKKLTAKLSLTDVFRTGSPSATIVFSNFKESFVATRDTRVVSLSLVYRFGKSAMPAKRHSSGAEEEKRRVSSGGG